MARAVYSSAPLSGAAPFLRTCRLGWGLVCHVFWFEAPLSAGLVCHVSAVSRGRSRVTAFTDEAATSRSCSPQIYWWSGGLHSVTISKKCWSPLVELANTTSSLKASTKRGAVVQAQAASPSFLGL